MTNNVNDNIKSSVATMGMPSSQQAYSQVLQLTMGQPVQLDFKSLVNQNRMDNVQGVWLDNSEGTSNLTLYVNSTLQNFTVPAGYQGVCPIYVTSDMTMVFTGVGQVTLILLNFPTPVGVWPAIASGQQTFTGGDLNTRDVNIAAAMDQSGVGVVEKRYGNADAIVRMRAGSVLSGNLTGAATTVLIAGAPSCFVSSIDVSVDGSASLAAVGALTVTLFFATSAARIFQRSVILPVAAPATPTPRYELFNQSDLAFIGALTGDNLSITLSAALTSGSVSYVIGGGTTAVD